jgi:hypothetical protein
MKPSRVALVTAVALVSGCATMSKSNTRRSTLRWSKPEMGEKEDWTEKTTTKAVDGTETTVETKRHGMSRTGPPKRVYCPEPVGPATKLNETTITVKSSTANLEGALSNAQTLGKIYDLSDIIQFSQYALFMNCVGWANGALDARSYVDNQSGILEDTGKLIRARIEAEAKAKAEGLAAAAQAAEEEALKAEQEAEAAKTEAEQAQGAADPGAKKGTVGGALLDGNLADKGEKQKEADEKKKEADDKAATADRKRKVAESVKEMVKEAAE